MILGLELLVAGDIIRAVVIAPTFSSIAVLVMIILVASFLSLALEIEVEGRLPWDRGRPRS